MNNAGDVVESAFLDCRMPTRLDLSMTDTGHRGIGQPRLSLAARRHLGGNLGTGWPAIPPAR